MMGKNRSNQHNRALSAIADALTLRDQPSAWCGLATILRARLTSYERACLFVSVAEALETDLLVEVVDTIVPARLAGAPLPILLDIEEDARWWADLATLSELRAWLAACFVRLPAREQQDFLHGAQRRACA